MSDCYICTDSQFIRVEVCTFGLLTFILSSVEFYKLSSFRVDYDPKQEIHGLDTLDWQTSQREGVLLPPTRQRAC
jgi:hypothetical protein